MPRITFNVYMNTKSRYRSKGIVRLTPSLGPVALSAMAEDKDPDGAAIGLIHYPLYP